jgi:hypothetical protein
LKIASLERLLETTKEELNATKKEAQSVTIRAADEAKRGIAEVIARSIEQHYGSLDEALAVANQSKTAVEWGRLSMFIPSASEEKLASIAERVFTETARLKTAHGK